MGYPRILVIDDEENFLGLLAKVLGKEGYEVRTTTDGAQGLQWFEDEIFDLAVVDIRMHPLDGLSILERIRTRRPDAKVIIMTAYPDEESRSLAALKSATAYLVKPIEIDELKLAIRRHLPAP
jgi:two-component system, response regulator, stage 0 sporulation protein F